MSVLSAFRFCEVKGGREKEDGGDKESVIMWKGDEGERGVVVQKDELIQDTSGVMGEAGGSLERVRSG